MFETQTRQAYNGPRAVKSTVTSPKGTGPQLLDLPNIEKLEKKFLEIIFFPKKFGKKKFSKKIVKKLYFSGKKFFSNFSILGRSRS